VPTPDGAIFEAVTPDPGVAVWDVSHLLPTLGGKPQPARPDGQDIVRIYVHKSGGEGPDGFRGVLGMARYVVQRRKFPGAPYTFWASTVPDVDAQGRLVLYRCAHDDRRTWHTGGDCNVHGVALALQGNLSKRELTLDQARVAEAAIRYARLRYPLSDVEPIGRHSRAKRYGAKKDKTVCPGVHGERWLDGIISGPLP